MKVLRDRAYIMADGELFPSVLSPIKGVQKDGY